MIKIYKKILIGFMAIAVIFSGFLFTKVNAQDQPLTEQQIEQVRSNCLEIKNTLNQLHISDALLRVNMGQIYESLTTKLMERFNSRVASNKFSNIDLVSATDSYGSMLNIFRDDYKTYEEQLSVALSIDCSKQPQAFYDAVSWARIKRQQVNADVKKLEQYIEQYRSAFDRLKKDILEPVIKGTNQ